MVQRGSAAPVRGVETGMSASTLTRPTSVLRDRTLTAAVGSYVDTDGVRRAPAVVGTYPGTTSAVGAYAGRPAAVGSYVRSER